MGCEFGGFEQVQGSISVAGWFQAGWKAWVKGWAETKNTESFTEITSQLVEKPFKTGQKMVLKHKIEQPKHWYHSMQ